MKKRLVLILILLAMSYGTAFAISVSFTDMHEITVHDGIDDSTYTGGQREGSQALRAAGEDNETEKSDQYLTYTDQVWDLEGMFFNGTDLYVVGGYDFELGYGGTTIGDLFLGDLNAGNFSPQYALVQDGNGLAVYQGGSYEATEYFPQSNPYKYEHTAGETPLYRGTISFGEAIATGFSDVWGRYGNNKGHNFVKYSLAAEDWAAIIGDGTFAHLTMTCGNDAIRGQLSPVPEPATILLSGLGLLGMGIFLRRKQNQKRAHKTI